MNLLVKCGIWSVYKGRIINQLPEKKKKIEKHTYQEILLKFDFLHKWKITSLRQAEKKLWKSLSKTCLSACVTETFGRSINKHVQNYSNSRKFSISVASSSE